MRNKWFIIGAAGAILAVLLIIGIVINKNLTNRSAATSGLMPSETGPTIVWPYPMAPTDTPNPLLTATDIPNNPTSSQGTGTSALTLTSSPGPTITASPTNTSISQPSSTPASSSTRTPTMTYTLIPSKTNTPTLVPTRTATPTLVLGSIAGRITFQGAPASGGLQLVLEDYLSNEIQRISVGADGSYAFTNLPVSPQGYNVVFAQEWNEQYPMEQVVSWAWIGPIPVYAGSNVQLNTFDISLMGLAQTNPTADTSVSAMSINQATPLIFAWSTYPTAVQYWVDLMQRDEQNQVWQSPLISSNSIAFNGILSDGSQISPGRYWWAVGAQGIQGGYPITVYGYLLRLIVDP